MKNLVIIGILSLLLINCKKENIELTPTKIQGVSYSIYKFNKHNYLRSIDFADSKTGIVCGFYGTIYRTETSGKSWTKIEFPTNYNLKRVEFISDSIGFILGGLRQCFDQNCKENSGIIFKTTDRGKSWKKVYKDTTLTGTTLSDISFIDIENGYVLGASTILKTKNGGESWEVDMPKNRKGNFEALAIKDGSLLALSQSGNLYYKNVFTQTWVIQQELEVASMSQLKFKENELYISDFSGIKKSNNLGKSWSNLKNAPVTNFNLEILKSGNLMLTVGNGYRPKGHWASTYGALHYSFDKGENWVGTNHFHETLTLYNCCIVDNQTAFAVSRTGVVKLRFN